MLGLVGSSVGSVAARSMDTPGTPTLPAPQAQVYAQELNILHDGQADLSLRAQAARNLLDTGWPQAQAALQVDLAIAPDLTTQRAVALALASMPNPPQAFAPILFDLLHSAPEALRADAAGALGRYPSLEVIQQLSVVAQNPRNSVAERNAAVLALGLHRSQAAAGALLRLTEPAQVQPVRAAAFAALLRITGQAELGQDYAAWQRWWAQHRALPAEAWMERLFDSLDRSRTRLNQQTQQLQDRLVDTQRQLYRVTPEDRRPALLLAWLSDPLEATRVLSLDLATQLLAEKGPAGFAADLRRQLLRRLDDPAPVLRQRAALLLRDLGEQPAADKLAAVLAAAREQRPELLQAYLQVLKRMPRAAAVPALLSLLEEPAVRREAALALAAAVDANFTNAAQQHWARQSVRRLLKDETTPDAALIALLGKLAQAEDWTRIAGWLSHADPVIQEAAASAWADADRPLTPLAQFVDDPVIQPILLAAAARRGQEPGVLLTLVDHKPRTEALLERWQQALVGLAGRVEPTAVREAVQILQRHGESRDLCIRLLSASLDHLGVTNVATALTESAAELLLTRARIHRTDRDLHAVLADCLRLAGAQSRATVAQRRAADLLALEATLGLNEREPVAVLVPRLIPRNPAERDPQTVERTATLLLDTAQNDLKTEHLDTARSLLTLLREATGTTLSELPAKRLATLESAAGILPPSTQSSPTPGTIPAPGTAPGITPAPGTAPGTTPGTSPTTQPAGKG